jgi:hypothetical protein
MADTYTSAAKARLIEDQTRSGTWGPTVNTDALTLIDDYVGGVEAINLGSSTSYSLAAFSNGTDSESRAAVLRFTGTPASAVTVTVPASVVDKYYRVENSTGQRLTIKYAASTGVVLGNLDKCRVWCNGTEVYDQGPGSRITAAEIAAGVTPTNYAVCPFPFYDVTRLGATDDDSTDNGSIIRSAAQVLATQGGGTLFFPFKGSGVYRYTGTLYYYGNYVNFLGASQGVFLRKTDTGTMLSADPDSHTVADYQYWTYCSLENLFLYSETADVGIDFSGFSYSSFKKFAIQLKGSNKKIFLGKGEQGAAPYYNVFDDFAMFGDNGGGTSGSVGFSFEEGAWTGGSNGPNANRICNMRRGASLDYLIDLRSGQGNMFSGISGEAIQEAYFRLNYRSADVSGTSSGSNTQATFNDTGKSWTTNQFTNATVRIVSGTGSGQARKILTNTATQLTIVYNWNTVPDATSTYEIYLSKCIGNKFSHLRSEGTAGSNPDFIQAHWGARDCKFSDYIPESLGSGAIVYDPQKEPSNSFWDGDLISLPFTVTGVSAGATVEFMPELGSAYYRGGFAVPGQFVVENVRVSCEGRTAGTATVTVTVGDTGGSGFTLSGILNADNPDYLVIPGNNTALNTEVNKISCSVTTDGSWAPTTGDIAVVVFVRLLH